MTVPTVDRAAGNRVLLYKLLVIAVLMFGFAFALIPFYREICAALGLNELTRADATPANTQVDLSRSLSVALDANPQPGSPLSLVPLRPSLNVHPGEFAHVEYRIVNQSQRRVWAQALPAYSPVSAAQYFHKLECFCFREMVLEPGESRTLPVVFVIDRQIPDSIGALALSYRVIEVAGKGGP